MQYVQWETVLRSLQTVIAHKKSAVYQHATVRYRLFALHKCYFVLCPECWLTPDAFLNVQSFRPKQESEVSSHSQNNANDSMIFFVRKWSSRSYRVGETHMHEPVSPYLEELMHIMVFVFLTREILTAAAEVNRSRYVMHSN